MRAHAVRLAVLAALAAVALALSACGDDDGRQRRPRARWTRSRHRERGRLPGARRPTTSRSRATPPASSTAAEKHTAETFAVGDLPDELEDADYDSQELGAFAYQTCSAKFQEFLGADESTVMRTIVSWAWFRPSEKAWDEGRPVVPLRRRRRRRGEQGVRRPAATTQPGCWRQQPTDDEWMVVRQRAAPCRARRRSRAAEKHNWRAVTDDQGRRPRATPTRATGLVEVTTRDYCSESVGAWLGYPPDYDFGYTWFHEGEWNAGNRRSVCWAATTA